ncbi:MAG TPA: hypothetical protein VFZ63_17740, partial [Jiangellaceae bacterium]
MGGLGAGCRHYLAPPHLVPRDPAKQQRGVVARLPAIYRLAERLDPSELRRPTPQPVFAYLDSDDGGDGRGRRPVSVSQAVSWRSSAFMISNTWLGGTRTRATTC